MKLEQICRRNSYESKAELYATIGVRGHRSLGNQLKPFAVGQMSHHHTRVSQLINPLCHPLQGRAMERTTALCRVARMRDVAGSGPRSETPSVCKAIGVSRERRKTTRHTPGGPSILPLIFACCATTRKETPDIITTSGLLWVCRV